MKECQQPLNGNKTVSIEKSKLPNREQEELQKKVGSTVRKINCIQVGYLCFPLRRFQPIPTSMTSRTSSGKIHQNICIQLFSTWFKYLIISQIKLQFWAQWFTPFCMFRPSFGNLIQLILMVGISFGFGPILVTIYTISLTTYKVTKMPLIFFSFSDFIYG